MNAARILRESDYDLDDLRALIGSVRPEAVNVWPASRRLRRFWRPGVKGVTQWRWIFVDPELFEDRNRLARLVIHELVHLRQFTEEGYLRFMFRYGRDYVRGRFSGLAPRDAYLAIPSEVEAREITSRLI